MTRPQTTAETIDQFDAVDQQINQEYADLVFTQEYVAELQNWSYDDFADTFGSIH